MPTSHDLNQQSGLFTAPLQEQERRSLCRPFHPWPFCWDWQQRGQLMPVIGGGWRGGGSKGATPAPREAGLSPIRSFHKGNQEPFIFHLQGSEANKPEKTAPPVLTRWVPNFRSNLHGQVGMQWKQGLCSNGNAVNSLTLAPLPTWL